MQQHAPTIDRPGRRLRRTAFGLVGVAIMAGGVLSGAEIASAATDSTFTDLSHDFANGVDDVYVGANITQTDGTLTLGPSTGTSDHTTLHLSSGTTLTVQAIELTSDQSGTMTGSKLVITGSGRLVIAQTDSSLPAIEVSSGSSLTISSGTVIASVPTDSTAAAIGGGPTYAVGPQNAGPITLDGTANVTATGGDQGAAIGGGYGGSASVDIDDSANVTAVVTGRAAAVGAGYGSGVFSVGLLHNATLTASQNGTGPTGAAVGGGASPTGQTAGTVTLGDEAHVTATSTGSGAAIGGGYHGDGGTIGATGYSSIDATGAQAAIGDGEHATNGGTSVTLSGLGVVVHAHGGTGAAGGAGIGGGSTAKGNDALDVNGGATLTASSDNGPGIGGLGNTVGMQVTIDSATVTATGGSGGAAIGAGSGSSIGAAVAINAGSTVSVGAGSTSAIGGATSTTFGSLSNAGALTLTSGSALTVPAGATAVNTGSITNQGALTVTGTLTNSGVITNTGSIGGIGTLDNTGGTITGGGAVTTSHIPGNNFRVTFAASPGTASSAGPLYVYTDSFSSAGLGVPTVSGGPGPFSGWNTAADGSGTWLTSIAQLATVAGSSSSDGSPVAVQLHALYLGVKSPSSRVVGGSRIKLTLTGLRTNETYTIRIGGTTLPAARATSNQTFTTTVTVPKSVTDGSQTVTISGDAHTGVARTTLLTAAASKSLGLKLSAKKVKHGKKIVITISKLYTGESARVVISGKHGKTAVGKATSKGVYVVTLKSGLAKGKYTVTVTGAGTGRKASAKLTVS